MMIEADDPKLQYSGRIDFSDPKAPVFVFPCTSVRMRFTGTVLKARVRNHKAYWDNYMGCILDGKQTAYRLPEDGEEVFDILADCGDDDHKDTRRKDGESDISTDCGDDDHKDTCRKDGESDISTDCGDDDHKDTCRKDGESDISTDCGDDNHKDTCRKDGESDISADCGGDNHKDTCRKEEIFDREEGFDILAEQEKKAGQEVHEVLLFKRQDACHEMTFCGFELAEDGAVLELDAKPARRIEVYGDSVSAGEVSEAVAYVGKEDPEHQGEYSNSWYSYAWMTARKLHAQIHDIAQGGIALMDRTGWFCDPYFIGMESVWDKLHYNQQLGKASAWDFARYTPHVVIVAIGQNDSNPEDYMKEDVNCQKAEVWRTHYKAFLENIRNRYPDAHIVCCTTLLEHDKSWDESIDQVCQELQDEKITHYRFRRNGNGTPGHLRIPEAEEMAEELTAYVESLPVEAWKVYYP